MISGGVQFARRVSRGLARRFSELRLQLQESTAHYAVRRLARCGIPRHKIRGEHLDFVYRQTRYLATAADFAAMKAIFPGTPGPEDKESSVWGVIVESRRYPTLEPVVSNVVEVLGIPV